MNNSLLPMNATPQERALAETVSRISDVPVLVRESHDPQRCPESLLPWLAWAYSVDEWQPHWTTQQKRDVVASSVEVHRRKGTLKAVIETVQSLGYRTKIVEWFENNQPEFTFDVNIYITDQPVNAQTIASARRMVTAAKNERSHFDINLIPTTENKLTVKTAALLSRVIRVGPYQPKLVSASGVMNVVSAVFMRRTIRVEPQ